MVWDEREKIRRFILGLQYPLCQSVGTQMETFPNFSAMVENARMMEIGEKTREYFQKKRKRGFEGKTLGQGGTWEAFLPPIRGRHHQWLPQLRYTLHFINPSGRWGL